MTEKALWYNKIKSNKKIRYTQSYRTSKQNKFEQLKWIDAVLLVPRTPGGGGVMQRTQKE